MKISCTAILYFYTPTGVNVFCWDCHLHWKFNTEIVVSTLTECYLMSTFMGLNLHHMTDSKVLEPHRKKEKLDCGDIEGSTTEMPGRYGRATGG